MNIDRELDSKQVSKFEQFKNTPAIWTFTFMSKPCGEHFLVSMKMAPVWEQEIMPQRRELIGWGPDDSGVYYFLMDPAIKAVNELFRGQGETRVINKEVLLDVIEQKDLLATPPGKSRSYSKTINKKTRWVTAIKGQVFDLE